MSQKALASSWKDEIAHGRDENLDEDKGDLRRRGGNWKPLIFQAASVESYEGRAEVAAWGSTEV